MNTSYLSLFNVEIITIPFSRFDPKSLLLPEQVTHDDMPVDQAMFDFQQYEQVCF
jgi:hypothetical protein